MTGPYPIPHSVDVSRLQKAKLVRFFKNVEKTGALHKSLEAVRLGKKWWRRQQKAHDTLDEFYQVARSRYVETLEAAADDRAIKGVDEPVYYEGEVVGHKKKYSDALLMFRLKGLNPERYAERGPGGGDTPTQIHIYIPDNHRDMPMTDITPPQKSGSDLIKR